MLKRLASAFLLGLVAALGAAHAAPASDAQYSMSTPDGAHVVFTTADRLVAADTDNNEDVYDRHDRTTTLISTGPNAGNGPSYNADNGRVTPDGQQWFFRTKEKLVASDTDDNVDVYRRTLGITTLMSTGSGPYDAELRLVSPDGAHVVFETNEQLSGADGDTEQDVYERTGGNVVQVSTGSGPHPAYALDLSDDGSRILFHTEEQLVAGDTDTRLDVYRRSLGQTVLVTPGSGDAQADYRGASDDGTRVFFETPESLVAADTDGMRDVYEREGATTTLISHGTAGIEAGFSGISADGGVVLYRTTEPVTADDVDGPAADIYRFAGGVTTLVSTGAADTGESLSAHFRAISDDGERIAFQTSARLVATDFDTAEDVYLRYGGVTKLASKTLGAGNADLAAAFAGATADGTHVVFETAEALLGDDGDTGQDLYERESFTTRLITDGPELVNNKDPQFEAISGDGERILFSSHEALTPADTDADDRDLYERSGGATRLVSGEAIPPETTIDSATGSTFAFSSSETGSSFECRVDAQPFAACTSPFTAEAAAPGTHTFEVQAADLNGNTDPTPASRTFEVAAPPVVAGGGAGGGGETGQAAGGGEAGGTGQPRAAKRSALALVVRAKRTKSKRYVRVSARCPDTACTVRIGKLVAKLHKGKTRTLRVTLTKRTRRALHRHRKATARITVTATAPDLTAVRKVVKIRLRA